MRSRVVLASLSPENWLAMVRQTLPATSIAGVHAREPGDEALASSSELACTSSGPLSSASPFNLLPSDRDRQATAATATQTITRRDDAPRERKMLTRAPNDCMSVSDRS